MSSSSTDTDTRAIAVAALTVGILSCNNPTTATALSEAYMTQFEKNADLMQVTGALLVIAVLPLEMHSSFLATLEETFSEVDVTKLYVIALRRYENRKKN